MIDSHMHLEWEDFDRDRDQLVEKWKKAGLKAVVSNSVGINDLEKSLTIRDKWPDFVFVTAALHPEYVKEITEAQVDQYFEKLEKNSSKLVGVGETGLDYFWVKEPEWRERQKQLFIRFIELAEKLKKPLVVHTRDAHEEVIGILLEQKVKRAHLHLWGARSAVKAIMDNGWLVSFGPLIATSKTHKKIAKDLPLEQILLETDSPWFGGKTAEGKPMRGEPTNIKIPAEKIAEAKSVSFEEVWLQCAKNAVRFYGLPLRL